MIIESRGAPLISGVQLRAGKHNYPAIDHKDPATALQLQALKNVGAIKFDEKIDPVPAHEALDNPEQELIIDVERKYGEQGEVTERIYKGSKIVNPNSEVVEEKTDVRKPDEPTRKVGEDGNTDKRSGRVSSKSKNSGTKGR